MEGSSMEPTLESGQYLLANKLVYMHIDPSPLLDLLPFVEVKRKEPFFPFHPPRRGDVIVFRFPRDPSRDFVKRVIGLPGDVVEIRRGVVFVNGQPLDEPYITKRSIDSMAPVRVPPGGYFVLGDNRASSNDSRDWGILPAENIIGRAWVPYGPRDRRGLMSVVGPS